MIKLLVGLGNPGRQYYQTRHNAGFWFLDGLAIDSGVEWVTDSRFHGIMSSALIGRQKVNFLKPDTFMNRSGLAVGALARYYKFNAEEILVVHDELDLEAGAVRLKRGGGHAGHNGLRDIISHLGSRDFYRLRIGIGRPRNGAQVADYVLSEPGKADKECMCEAIKMACEKIHLVVTGQNDLFMNQLHGV